MERKHKTFQTEASVLNFINSYVENEFKKKDCLKLLTLMQSWSNCEPKMWGPTIIGFGVIHYKYPSGHEGDSLIIGFSPRKAEFSLYVGANLKDNAHLIGKLGRIRLGKACVYFKNLEDINLRVLKRICSNTINLVSENGIKSCIDH